MKIIYFPVHNLDYPRNKLIRTELSSLGYNIEVIDRGHGAFEKTGFKKKVSSVIRLISSVRKSDIVILSEQSNQYAILTGILAKVFRKVHIVDGFIGLYETKVLDSKKVKKNSIKAKLLRLLDWVSVNISDIYLIDTEMRADDIRLRYPSCRHKILSIGVGVPEWGAKVLPTDQFPDAQKYLLFYGNFSKLHGVSFILRAYSKSQISQKRDLVLIGDGPEKQLVDDEINELGIFNKVKRVGRIPESELASYLGPALVVFGVFGKSRKAESVIPNKVWQAAATGKHVITRKSDVYQEVEYFLGSNITQIDPDDLLGLIALLDSLDESKATRKNALEESATYIRKQIKNLDRAIQLRLNK